MKEKLNEYDRMIDVIKRERNNVELTDRTKDRAIGYCVGSLDVLYKYGKISENEYDELLKIVEEELDTDCYGNLEG